MKGVVYISQKLKENNTAIIVSYGEIYPQFYLNLL